MNTDERVVRLQVQDGVDAIVRGWGWIEGEARPALARLEGRGVRRSVRLVSHAHYVMGDIDHFLGAPRSALGRYRRAVEIDPTHAGAWRECGSMLALLGRGKQAARMLGRAVELGDELAEKDLRERQSLEDEPFKMDRCWRVRELLAMGRVTGAQRLAKSSLRTVEDWLHLARVRGAMGDYAGVCACWEKVVEKRQPVVTACGDWYYLPRPLGDCPALLGLMARAVPKWDVEGSVQPWGVEAEGKNRRTLGRELRAAMGRAMGELE